MTNVASIFAADCREQLERLESALLQLETAPREKTFINAAFRAIHTIKGNASVLSYAELEWFAHVVESVLDRVRCGTVLVRSELITLLLASKDHLHLLLGLASIGEQASPYFADLDRARLIGQLAPYLERETTVQTLASTHTSKHSRVADGHWRLEVRFDSKVLRQGCDPHYFLRHLESIASSVRVRALTDCLPNFAGYDPEACYLHFEVELESTADKHAIEDVFTFVRDSVHLRINPPRQQVELYLAKIEALSNDDLRLGEVLVRVGALTASELATALRLQRAADPSNDEALGAILIGQNFVPPVLVDAVLARQQRLREDTARAAHYVKVPLDKLDHLISIVDSLHGTLLESAALSRPALRGAGDLALQASSLARSVRQTRVSDAFGRFHRWVRDSSAKLGKQADFELVGGELHIDYELAERLNEPLVHLIRNSLDHGIETPAERASLGKSPSGKISLSLNLSHASLSLSVSDDGRGIDRARLAAAAREHNWLSLVCEPTDDDLLPLLFRPGFTTSNQVTSYSGRGVGLDVVKQSIDLLRGRIDVHSKPGEGTSFCIRLPLITQDGSSRAPFDARSAA